MKCLLHVTDKKALPTEYLTGFELFNEGRYYEAHEIWEKVWLRSEGLDRLFYQGLIQTAAALLKIEEKKNLEAAKRLFNLALSKLSELPDLYMGLNVREFEIELRKNFGF